MADTRKMESNLYAEISKHWKILKDALEKGKIDGLEIAEIYKKYTFMRIFDDFLDNTKPQFDILISDLGTIYRGVGVNEEIALDYYSRMIPDPERVKGHNRMNPPGKAFIYLAVIPKRKGKKHETEKNFILKTIESELRVKPGDFYTVARFVSNTDNPIFDMAGEPRARLDLNKLANEMKKKNADIGKLAARTFITIFNNEEIFKPVHSNDQEYRAGEYAPFQLLAKYLQNKGYAGIKYRSTVHHGGTNVVIFDTNDIQLIENSMERITG